ncbi:MAG: hypothetical protein LBT25_04495 [Candidatus Symbiothrix sp.]|jgi:hypothetical protein|nr:hypothetical protein [Candidatus Symbiothrix sp.]
MKAIECAKISDIKGSLPLNALLAEKLSTDQDYAFLKVNLFPQKSIFYQNDDFTSFLYHKEIVTTVENTENIAKTKL